MESAVKITAAKALTSAFQVVLVSYPVGMFRVDIVHLSNVTPAAHTVQVCYVPSGGVPAVGNAVLWDFNVPANDFIEFGEGDYLTPLTTIWALASVDDSINMRVAGTQE